MSAGDISALNMYGGFFPYTNTYNNQVGLNDLYGFDFYSSPMSMTGSIFPMGYPIGGMSQNYYDNYLQYQDFMINNRASMQQKMRNADLMLNSPQEGIAKQASILKEKIMQNEQSQIIPAYKAYLESVRNMYKGMSETDIANRASTLYSQIYNTSIIEDIRKYGRGSFEQGLLQTLTLGLINNTTAEENISKLTKQPVSKEEQAKKLLGNVTGGTILGAGGAIAANSIWKFKGPIAKAVLRVPVLAAIAGAAMAVTAFIVKE